MRGELAALAGMDGRDLADIGLMPTDISNALASIGPNKTSVLARFVNERAQPPGTVGGATGSMPLLLS